MPIGRKVLASAVIGLLILFLAVSIFWLGQLVGEARLRGGGLPGPGTPEWQPFRGFPLPFGRPMTPRAWFGSHGALSVVGKVEGNTIVVAGPAGRTQTILVTDHTILEKGRQRIVLTDIRAGDHLIVIGAPKGEGEIEARAIRVLELEDRSR